MIPAVGTNHTDMHCPVFREGNPANSASHRAGVMVHEGWHHWQYDKSFSLNHPTGGSAAGWPGGGDWFYPHTLSRFAFGQLHGYSTSPSNFHFHSPYQVQAEFLADVAELSPPQIPTAITQTARARGNAILAGPSLTAPHTGSAILVPGSTPTASRVRPGGQPPALRPRGSSRDGRLIRRLEVERQGAVRP